MQFLFFFRSSLSPLLLTCGLPFYNIFICFLFFFYHVPIGECQLFSLVAFMLCTRLKF